MTRPTIFCCGKLQENAAQFEWYAGWNVGGCCGGGCYVLTELIYCPWCGVRISVPESETMVQAEAHPLR